MRIKLILPALAESSNNRFRPIKYALFPPLGLAQLAAYLDEKDEIEIVDLHVQQDDFSDTPDLVVLQTYITNAYRAYEIADLYRKRGVFVVTGGLHATSLPTEALAHSDAVITGPAHQAWKDFITAFRQGKRPAGIFTDSCRSLAGLPLPRRDLIKRQNYLVPNSIVVSRGCSNRCDFCYTRNFFAGGKSFYTAEIDRILSEIDSLPGKHLFFLDDNLFDSPEFAAALFDGMQGMNRYFQGAATVNGVLNDKLLAKAAAAGLRSLFIGFESLNPDSLKACNKIQNHTGMYHHAIANMRSLGIMTNASFVFGLPEDHPDVFKRTVDWAVSQGIETATFHLATPYPGTPFYQKMKEQNRLLSDNWELYDTRHAIIRHDFMTPAELENGYWQSYRDFYSWKNIFSSAAIKETTSKRLRHLLYTGGWKKSDPLWHLLIRLKSLPFCSGVLEKVLNM